MQICPKHNEEHVPRGKRTGCKSCNNEYQARWRAANTALARQRSRDSARLLRRKQTEMYLSLFTSCIDCGEDRIPCLDFDHRDPSSKLFSVSQGFRTNHTWEEIKAEAAKCDIRCANCHRLKTATDNHWYEGQ